MSDLHRFCKTCEIATNEFVCSKCGHKTEEDMPIEIYWCSSCSVPVIQSVNQANRGCCSLCGRKMKYLSTDLRPVFPEERLLVELLLKKKPHELLNNSVWAENNRYYIDGKSTPIPTALFQEADAAWPASELATNRKNNSYEKFNRDIARFVQANQTRLYYDFVTLPRPLDAVSSLTLDQAKRDHTLVKNELARVYEFGRMSMNSMVANELIWAIEEAYHLDTDQYVGKADDDYE